MMRARSGGMLMGSIRRLSRQEDLVRRRYGVIKPLTGKQIKVGTAFRTFRSIFHNLISHSSIIQSSISFNPHFIILTFFFILASSIYILFFYSYCRRIIFYMNLQVSSSENPRFLRINLWTGFSCRCCLAARRWTAVGPIQQLFL